MISLEDITRYAVSIHREDITFKKGISNSIEWGRNNSPSHIWSTIENIDFDSGALEMREWLKQYLSMHFDGHQVRSLVFELYNPVIEGVIGGDVALIGVRNLLCSQEAADRYVEDSDDSEGQLFVQTANSSVINTIEQLIWPLRDDVVYSCGRTIEIAFVGLAVRDICKEVPHSIVLNGCDDRAFLITYYQAYRYYYFGYYDKNGWSSCETNQGY